MCKPSIVSQNDGLNNTDDNEHETNDETFWTRPENVAVQDMISKLDNASCFLRAGLLLEDILYSNSMQVNDLPEEVRPTTLFFINAKNEFMEFLSGLNFPDPQS